MPAEDTNPLLESILSVLLKLVIWVPPVFLMISKVEKKSPVTYIRLTLPSKKDWLWITAVLCSLLVYFSLLNKITGYEIQFALNTDTWVNTFLIVGFTEEIVFRGYILNKFMERWTFWKANVLTAALFVTIHFPAWYEEGVFTDCLHFGSISLQIAVISLLLGWIYKKTSSLWPVIIIHSFYDLFTHMFL